MSPGKCEINPGEGCSYAVVTHVSGTSEGCRSAQWLSHVQIFVAPWTVAHQAPLSVRFPRREYWAGLPLPSPDLLDPGIKAAPLASPALAGELEPQSALVSGPPHSGKGSRNDSNTGKVCALFLLDFHEPLC